jgi:hypothetical protein
VLVLLGSWSTCLRICSAVRLVVSYGHLSPQEQQAGQQKTTFDELESAMDCDALVPVAKRCDQCRTQARQHRTEPVDSSRLGSACLKSLGLVALLRYTSGAESAHIRLGSSFDAEAAWAADSALIWWQCFWKEVAVAARQRLVGRLEVLADAQY